MEILLDYVVVLIGAACQNFHTTIRLQHRSYQSGNQGENMQHVLQQIE
jgi:hypothetical protein